MLQLSSQLLLCYCFNIVRILIAKSQKPRYLIMVTILFQYSFMSLLCIRVHLADGLWQKHTCPGLQRQKCVTLDTTLAVLNSCSCLGFLITCLCFQPLTDAVTFQSNQTPRCSQNILPPGRNQTHYHELGGVKPVMMEMDSVVGKVIWQTQLNFLGQCMTLRLV